MQLPLLYTLRYTHFASRMPASAWIRRCAAARSHHCRALQHVIHRAKLAPYRDELLSLLNAWQEGEARISVPLNRIEELIDADVLEPDVLVLRGDYEHYRYD